MLCISRASTSAQMTYAPKCLICKPGAPKIGRESACAVSNVRVAIECHVSFVRVRAFRLCQWQLRLYPL